MFTNASNKESNKLININNNTINNTNNNKTEIRTNRIKTKTNTKLLNKHVNLSKTPSNVSKFQFSNLIHVLFTQYRNLLLHHTPLYVNLFTPTDKMTILMQTTNKNNNNTKKADTRHVSLSDPLASTTNIKM